MDLCDINEIKAFFAIILAKRQIASGSTFLNTLIFMLENMLR